MFSEYAAHLNGRANEYDVWYIVNAWYADLCRTYYKRDAAGYEAAIIEDALTWGFLDEDAPDGKVWRYYEAMAQ